ncbi:MAG: hypothetical protein PHO15_06555 [Eubacteriales bacterium]|nr:hypothetical protein [Eubacteriales bacterium]
MKIKPVTYFLCAVTLILMAVSPWLILSSYEEQPEVTPYKGILTLWHITDWRTGGSSGTAFLKMRIAEFESKNPYVFIEMQSMSISETKVAFLRGETPDIISYPISFEPGFSLSSLPSKDILFREIPDTAYPYMCGGYCILVNIDLLDEQGLYLSEGWGIRPDELLAAAQFGICFDSENGYSSLPAIALHEYPEAPGPNISTWGEPALPDAALGFAEVLYEDGLQAFIDGRCCVLIASQRQLFEIEQLYEQGEAPAFSAYAAGGYTDMIQLVSVAACDDEKKSAVLAAFAEYMVSDRVQAKLEPLGVFPVVSGLEIYADNECLSAMYRLLSENAALPAAGNRETLDALAKQSFAGDSSALKRLRQLLRKSD